MNQELLSQETPWKSQVNPQRLPTPPSGGKSDGRENKRTVPGKANGTWLQLSWPRTELAARESAAGADGTSLESGPVH